MPSNQNEMWDSVSEKEKKHIKKLSLNTRKGNEEAKLKKPHKFNKSRLDKPPWGTRKLKG